MRKLFCLIAATAVLSGVMCGTAWAQGLNDGAGLVSNELPARLAVQVKGGIKSSAPGRSLGKDMDLDHGVRFVPAADAKDAPFTLLWLKRDGSLSGDLYMKYKGRDVVAKFETKLNKKEKWGENIYYKSTFLVPITVAWQGFSYRCEAEMTLHLQPRPRDEWRTMISQSMAPKTLLKVDPVKGCTAGPMEHLPLTDYVKDGIQPRNVK